MHSVVLLMGRRHHRALIEIKNAESLTLQLQIRGTVTNDPANCLEALLLFSVITSIL